jgi:hypothetical protein
MGKIKFNKLVGKISFNLNPHSTCNASVIYSKAHRTIYGLNELLESGRGIPQNLTEYSTIF